MGSSHVYCFMKLCLPVHLNSITSLYILQEIILLPSLVRLERDACAQVLHVAHTFASAVYLVMVSYMVVHTHIYICTRFMWTTCVANL